MARGEVDKGICLTNAKGEPLRESLVKPNALNPPLQYYQSWSGSQGAVIVSAIIVSGWLSFVSNEKCLHSSC